MATITQIAQTDPGLLLAYSAVSIPDPIQVSPQQGDPSKAALTIVVNNPNSNTQAPVYLQRLVLRLPVGSDSASLITPKTTFQATVSPGSLWQASNPTADGIVIVTPRSGAVGKITSDGVTITLYDISVNQTVGTSQLTISEAASLNQTGPFNPHALIINLSKFPYAFFAGDFHAEAIQVNNGGQTTLYWIGSENATYTLLWGTNTQNVSNVRSWKTPQLFDTTVFYLSASTTRQGETVTQYFSLTIVVANPNITATTLEVLQNTTLDADLLLKGTATLQGTLNVAGTTALKATTADSLTTYLAQTRNATISNAFIDYVTVREGLALNGQSTLFGRVQSIGLGSFTAPTDGFLIATIVPAGVQGDQKCFGIAAIEVFSDNHQPLLRASCSGGILITNDGPAGVENMAFLPVARNNICQTSITNAGGNTVNPTYTFWWVPLGQGNLSATDLGAIHRD